MVRGNRGSSQSNELGMVNVGGKMIITEKNRYRVLRTDNNDYLVDLSSYWWGCLLGMLVWLLPIKVIKIEESIKYDKKQIISLDRILGIVLLVIIIWSSETLKFNSSEFSIYKLIICVLVFGILFFIRILYRGYNTKLFYKKNPNVKIKQIRAKINFRGKRVIVACVVMNFFLQIVLGLGCILIFLGQKNTNGIFPLVFLGNWIFLFVGEWTKAPFLSNNIFSIAEY